MTPHPLLADAFGLAPDLDATDREAARAADRMLDMALERFDWRRLYAAVPIRRVLLLAPAYAEPVERRRGLPGRLRVAAGTRHRVTIQVDDRPDVSRLAKIDEAAAKAVSDHDWLVVVDDDVAVGAQFLDRLIAAAEAADLAIAQPAQRFHSHAAFAVTRRRAHSIVRTSHFVEAGPVVAIRTARLPELLPLPESRWGWGVDILWADLAWREGWRLGIIDGAPMEHLRPINFDLPHRRPLHEASLLLDRLKPTIGRRQMLAGDRIVIGF